ncbi:hypothetical protein L227DRAFT_59512 [Lentinus tigrinus ALCF2SS1-6]|uniref:Uncharacterized protein n=1 Tax=Lentinus tigrinus ALCF2SS1-6 TaxID=1328759 RepID=A0A5C2SEP0_9APHY|nr:hypothetical protein L227DRAFT_59512 [Lentinus tigrinus ALCF2SS1-6]
MHADFTDPASSSSRSDYPTGWVQESHQSVSFSVPDSWIGGRFGRVVTATSALTPALTPASTAAAMVVSSVLVPPCRAQGSLRRHRLSRRLQERMRCQARRPRQQPELLHGYTRHPGVAYYSYFKGNCPNSYVFARTTTLAVLRSEFAPLARRRTIPSRSAHG